MTNYEAVQTELNEVYDESETIAHWEEEQKQRECAVDERAKHALDEAVARFEKTRSLEDYKSIEVNWDFWSDVFKDINGVRPHWYRLPLSDDAMQAFKAYRYDMDINPYE